MTETIRPTKKQKELLTFIEKFIQQHGYSPSYREIMSGLQYNSVATVALHVNSLVKRGHLIKRDNSARSLEITKPLSEIKITTNQIDVNEEKWLIEKVSFYFNQAEQQASLETNTIDGLYVLIGALKVLGLEGAAQSFIPRLTSLKKRAVPPTSKPKGQVE